MGVESILITLKDKYPQNYFLLLLFLHLLTSPASNTLSLLPLLSVPPSSQVGSRPTAADGLQPPLVE